MTTYTQSNGFAVLQPFDPSIRNSWGAPNSTNATLEDQSLDGLVTIDISNRLDYTLTVGNGVPDERRYRMKTFIGTLASACNIHMPNVQKIGYVRNATTGGQILTPTAGGGTTLTVPNDNLWYLYWTDGFTNVSSLNVGVGGQTTTGDLTVGGSANVTANISAGGAIASGGGMFSASGGITAQGTDQGGAQFRAIGGGRAMFIHNDGSSTFFMQTAAGQPFGSWDSLRPFSWNMSTGAVSIDGTHAGTSIGGALIVGGTTACNGGLTVSGAQPVLNDGGTYAINITGSAATNSGGTVNGSQTITGNLTVNGRTNFGTGAQFYAEPNASGNQQLNFASGQYIQYHGGGGAGFTVNTSGGITLTATDLTAPAITAPSLTASGTVSGNLLTAPTVTAPTINAGSGAHILNASGAFLTTLAVTGSVSVSTTLNVSGLVSLGGAAAISGNGCYVIQPSVATTPGAWGPVAIGCNASNSYVGQGFFTTSDARAKEAIETISPARAREWIDRARPVTFTWKGGKDSSGFIAQEEWINGRGAALVPVPDARPEYAESDGTVAGGYRLTRDYAHDVAYLTAALQHVMRELDELKAATAGDTRGLP